MVTPARWWVFPLAGLAHALLMAVAFPPLNVWPVALIAIWPLVWAGCAAGNRPLLKALLVAVGVSPLWAFEQWWLRNVTEPGYPGLVVYMSLYSALFVWMVGIARRVDWPVPMGVVVAIAWTGLEFLRGNIALTGYGFYLLAHPLIEVVSLAAPAAVGGTYLVSLLTSALGGCLADAAGWTGVPRRVGGTSAGVVIAMWFILSLIGLNWGGSGHAESASGTDVRVGVVQTNIPQDNKMSWPIAKRLEDFGFFGELSRQAAVSKPSPDLIVWPETMFPGYALNASAIGAEREAGVFYNVDESVMPGGKVASTHFADQIVKLQRELGVTMLIGAATAEGLEFSQSDGGGVRPHSTARYNSAAVLAGGELDPRRYDKIDLTPFGEVIPYVWRWPSIQQRILDLGARGMGFDLSAGTSVKPLTITLNKREGETAPRTVDVATPICFEVTRSELCRRLVEGDGQPAGLMVNLSNDGWFGEFDGGRAAHLLAARWRCIELNVPMVRAVNTGISAIIDRRGRIVADVPTPPPPALAKPAASAAAPATAAIPSAGATPPAPTPGRGGATSGLRAQVPGVLLGTVRVSREPVRTIFRTVGDWAGYGSLGLCGLMWVVMVVRRRVLNRLGG